MIALIYFVPVLTTLMWFVTFLIRADSQRRRTYAIALLGEFCFYILYSVFVFPDTDYLLMVKLDSALVPVSLLAGAFLTMYVHMLRTGRKPGAWYSLLLLPAIIIGSTVGILYYLIGFDTASELTRMFLSGEAWPSQYDGDLYNLYSLFDYSLKHVFGFIMIATVIVECLFCLWGRNSGTQKLIASLTLVEMLLLFPTAIAGRNFMVEHSLLSAAIAFTIGISIHLRSQMELHHDWRMLWKIWRKPAAHGDSFTDQGKEKERANLSKLLETEVRKMLEEDEIFKDNSLTVNSMAKKFGVSRSTMSAVISSAYGENFRDVVNRHRINYAKSYMLAHPKATQEAIAAECGFKDGNLFNRKFKEIEGITPLVWMVRNLRQE